MGLVINTYTAGGITLSPADNPVLVTSTGTVVSTPPGTVAIYGTGSYQLTNNGTISATYRGTADGVHFANGGTIINAPSASGPGLITGDHAGVEISGTVGTVINSGTIAGTGSPGNGVVLQAGGYVSNASTGTISGYHIGIDAGASGSASTVVNDGTVLSTQTAAYSGLVGEGILLSAGGTVVNDGLVAADYGTGVDIHSNGTVDNFGTISSASQGTRGVGVYLSGGGVVTNEAGALITAYRDAIAVASGVATVTNYGTVESTGAKTSTIYLGAGGVVTNEASGVILATRTGVNVNSATGTIANLGTIVDSGSVINSGSLRGPAIFLPQGGLFINGATNATGALVAAYELPVYAGGSAGVPMAGALSTVVNYGTILQTALGTVAVSAIELVAGGLVLNGPGGATGALIESAASAAIYLPQGGSVVNYGTIASDGTHSALATGAQSGPGAPGTVINYGVIAEKGSSANIAAVHLLQGGYARNAAGATMTGVVGGIAIDGAVGTAVNDGTIQSTGTGGRAVELGAAGSVLDNYGTVNDAGSAGVGVALNAAATVKNGLRTNTTALITGSNDGVDGFTGLATIVNYATIAGRAGDGINLFSGGSVTNGAATSTAALITGNAAGVAFFNTAATLTNFATVSVSGAFVPGVALNAGGSVANYGTILGPSVGGIGALLAGAGRISNEAIGVIAGNATGVDIAASGSLVNYGTVESLNTVSGQGIILNPGVGIATAMNYGAVLELGSLGTAVDLVGDGLFVNGGTGAPGAMVKGGTGVAVLGTAGTVVNFGTIIGASGTAVRFGSGTDLLAVEPGAVFGGVVAGFTQGDTIDFAQTTVTSVAFNSNTLTAFNGGVVVATLGLPGTFTTGQFALYSDGSGGTDVTVLGPGTIYSGTITTGIYLSDPAAQNPATVDQTGYVINTTSTHGGDTVYGTNAATWHFTNLGTLNATANPQEAFADGVFFRAGGVVINGATGSAGGLIEAYGAGVDIGSAGNVTNLGTISGSHSAGVVLGGGGIVTNGANGATGALIRGRYEAIDILGSPGTVVNFGSLISLTGEGPTGVFLQAGGSVTNNAGALIEGYFEGLAINGGGTVANSGTIINSATYGGAGVFLYSGGSVDNRVGGTITGIGYGVEARTNPGTVVNYGSISATGTAGIGVYLAAGGSATNMSGGYILGEDAGIEIAGTPGSGATVVNAGTVVGDSIRGIWLTTSGTLTNNAGGVIDGGQQGVYADLAATVGNFGTITGGATGIALAAGGLVTNANGATISGYGNGVYISGNLGTVVNRGSIASTTTNGAAIYLKAGGLVTNGASGAATGVIDARSNGVAIFNAAGTVVNFATICSTGGYGYGIVLNPGGTVVNDGLVTAAGGFAAIESAGTNAGFVTNFGTAAGHLGVVFATAGSTLVNGGRIDGSGGTAVQFAGGAVANRLVLLPGESFGGIVYAGSGLDLFELGSAAASGTVAGGFRGFGSLTEDAGAVWTVPGYFNFPAATIAAGGILHETGTLEVVGGVTNSGRLEIDNAGTLKLDNGIIGSGTLAFAGSGGLVQVGTADKAATLGNPVVNFAQGDTLDFSAVVADGATYSGGVVTLSNAGTVVTALTVATPYQKPVFTVGTDGAGGVLLTDAPGLGHVFSGTYTSGIALYVPSLQNPAFITATANVTNTTATLNGDAVYGTNATAWTLSNYGQVLATQAGAAGVELVGGGVVTNAPQASIAGVRGGVVISGNAGTVFNYGAISGAAVGVLLSGTGSTLVNGGQISGGGAAVQLGGSGLVAVRPGAFFGGAVLGGGGATLELLAGSGAGTLSALGTNYTGFSNVTVDAGAVWHLAGSDVVATGVGVTIAGTLFYDGTLDNAGTISVANGGIFSDPGSLLNSGTVSGPVSLAAGGYLGNAAGALITASGAAVVAADGATVVNAGTIAGSPAVSFAGTGDLLVEKPGAVLSGPVAGGGGALELAAGSATGTLAGLGVSLTGFGSLTVDQGAVWQVTASTAAPALRDDGALLVSDGTLGFAAVTTGGSGTVQLSGTAVAEFAGAVAAGVTVAFAGPATARLDQVGAFAGTVGGFAAGDTLDLAGVVATSVGFDGQALTVFSGGTVADTIALPGTFTPSQFVLIADGNGGTDITVANGLVLRDPATQNPTTIAAGDTIANPTPSYSGDAVYGTNAAAWTLTNYGHVLGTQAGASGIAFVAGGEVSNFGTIEGAVAGVTISGAAGTVVNAGTISGGAAAVSFGGAGNLVVWQPGAVFGGALAGSGSDRLELAAGSGEGTLAGLGTAITGFSAITVDPGAVWHFTGLDTVAAGDSLVVSGTLFYDTLVNAGTVMVDGVLSDPAGTLVNQGMVTGPVSLTAGGFVENDGVIASITGSGGGDTVVNAGTIAGAVSLTGGGDLVAVAPGAVFGGPVSGAGGDALELMAGGSSGQLTGLGSDVTGFGTVTIDPGAVWRIGIGSSGFNGTLAGLAPGDVIDLAGVTASQVSFADGAIVFTAPDGSTTARLALSGQYTTADFRLASNGAGGLELSVISASAVGVFGFTYVYGDGSAYYYGTVTDDGTKGYSALADSGTPLVLPNGAGTYHLYPDGVSDNEPAGLVRVTAFVSNPGAEGGGLFVPQQTQQGGFDGTSFLGSEHDTILAHGATLAFSPTQPLHPA